MGAVPQADGHHEGAHAPRAGSMPRRSSLKDTFMRASMTFGSSKSMVRPEVGPCAFHATVFLPWHIRAQRLLQPDCVGVPLTRCVN